MNQAVHYADLVCWLCGPPEVLSATCATLAHDIEVEDLALALLRFESGALGMLEASTVTFPGLPDDAEGQRHGGDHRLGERGARGAALQDGDQSVMEGDVGAAGFPGATGRSSQTSPLRSSRAGRNR